MIIISYLSIIFPVITIMGLTTNVSENNSSVQACVNVTQGTVESSDNSVYACISTSASTGSNSAIGKTTIEFEPCREGILFDSCTYEQSNENQSPCSSFRTVC